MAVDPHCFDADPDPDPAQNLPRIQIQIRGGGGGCRAAKHVHPPWPSPRYAPACGSFLLAWIQIRITSPDPFLETKMNLVFIRIRDTDNNL
jgi:hypothetical protein